VAKIRYVFVLGVLLVGLVGLNVSLGLAQGVTETWTAGPGVAGTGSGLTLRTESSDSPVGAPASVSDGSTSKVATQFPSSGTSVRYLYYDVDTSGFPAGFSFARVDVEFLDESVYGGSRLRLEYDGTASAFQGSDFINTLGSGRFQTATFHLSNVRFQTSQNLGFSDFRVLDVDNRGFRVSAVTVTGSTTSTRPSGTTPVNFNAGANPSANGLDVKSAGDGVVSFSTDFGRTAVKVSSASNSPTAGNIYFDVDNAYMSNGSPSDAAIDVTYYDSGYGFFYIVYDALPSGGFLDSFGPSTAYQTNNVVYLQNSNTWKSYRFTISNARFGGGLLGGISDFKITQPRGGAFDVANKGYDLQVEKVIVTRSTTPIDKTGEIEGNYSGFGAPAWVWTQLGSTNLQGHGLYQEETTAATTATTIGGVTGRQASNGAIYFNINDTYLKDGADSGGAPIKSVLIGVEFYDGGAATAFTIDYESTSGQKSANVVTLTGSNQWTRTSFYITDGKFNNGLTGGNDFLVKVTGGPNDLVVRDVIVTRTVGEHRAGSVPTGFGRNQRIAGVHHFPVFDGFRPSLWEHSTMAPAGTGADAYTADAAGGNFANTNYSFRSIATHVKDLTDMRDAGFDFFTVWFPGNLIEMNTQAVVATRQLVGAAVQVQNAPKFALLLDPVHVKAEPFIRNVNTNLDLNDEATQGQLIKIAEDYFSLVPRERWATIDGRPMIFLYYQGSDIIATQNTGLIARLRERFLATHGVDPYVIPDRLYDPNATLNLPADDFFSWGAGECSSCVGGSSGFAQRSTFEIGPGFNDGTRVRDRENGGYYERGWDRASGKGNHIAIVDTWNYWVEGAAIAESREYGRQYIDISATKTAEFKSTSRNYSSATTVSTDMSRSPAVVNGLMQDEVPSSLSTFDPAGGRRAAGPSMSFSVHDSFQESAAADVRITVVYLDAGVNIIDVKVDGASGEVLAGRIDVRNSNTGAFKTAAFNVSAYFGNRLTFANDIRLDTDVAGQMVIQSVTVERLGAAPATPTPTPASTCANQAEPAGAGAVPTPSAGTLRTFLPFSPRNYCHA
jgi:hypothetical protein